MPSIEWGAGTKAPRAWCKGNVTATEQSEGYTSVNRLLPAATKLGQGNIFTRVCDSVNRGGLWNFRGGAFWSEIFGGGAVWNFFLFFFNFFSHPPPPPRRSMCGRYASYWNAFLFRVYLHWTKAHLKRIVFFDFNAVADLRGGTRDAPPPGAKIISFSCSFRPKKIGSRTHFGSWRPPPRGKSWICHCNVNISIRKRCRLRFRTIANESFRSEWTNLNRIDVHKGASQYGGRTWACREGRGDIAFAFALALAQCKQTLVCLFYRSRVGECKQTHRQRDRHDWKHYSSPTGRQEDENDI